MDVSYCNRAVELIQIMISWWKVLYKLKKNPIYYYFYSDIMKTFSSGMIILYIV